MKKTGIFTKVLSILLVVLTLGYIMSVGVFAADAKTSAKSTTHALVLTSEATSVAIGKTVQMTAKVSNVDKQPTITWSTSDANVASVDSNGAVKGKAVGKAVIKASAKVDGNTVTGEFAINVVKNEKFIQNYLENHQILSYQYSYVDDYYYTNDKEAWQKHFGFGKIYDIASPFLLLEYDYIRIFFVYENKDWMIQFWKGQYGMIFYGGEVGVYNRAHSEEGINDWTFYGCAKEGDWLAMDMTLYHRNLDGEYVREFTREYDKYWWCTGFKNGHLRIEEPADELRLAGRITFKDELMAQIVYDGLRECGFKEGKKPDHAAIDTVYLDGKDIHYSWQNISEAESTMAIKVVGGAIGTAALLPLFAPIMIPYAGFFLLMCGIASLIV